MFEIGFSELVLIGIIALLVFGPDKLPGLARNVGLWTGRIKRMVNSVQHDFQREIAKAEELQRLVEEQKQLLERHVIIDESKLNVPVTGKSATAIPPPATPPAEPVAPPAVTTTPAVTPSAPTATPASAHDPTKVS